MQNVSLSLLDGGEVFSPTFVRFNDDYIDIAILDVIFEGTVYDVIVADFALSPRVIVPGDFDSIEFFDPAVTLNQEVSIDGFIDNL